MSQFFRLVAFWVLFSLPVMAEVDTASEVEEVVESPAVEVAPSEALHAIDWRILTLGFRAKPTAQRPEPPAALREQLNLLAAMHPRAFTAGFSGTKLNQAKLAGETLLRANPHDWAVYLGAIEILTQIDTLLQAETSNAAPLQKLEGKLFEIVQSLGQPEVDLDPTYVRSLFTAGPYNGFFSLRSAALAIHARAARSGRASLAMAAALGAPKIFTTWVVVNPSPGSRMSKRVSDLTDALDAGVELRGPVRQARPALTALRRAPKAIAEVSLVVAHSAGETEAPADPALEEDEYSDDSNPAPEPPSRLEHQLALLAQMDPRGYPAPRFQVAQIDANRAKLEMALKAGDRLLADLPTDWFFYFKTMRLLADIQDFFVPGRGKQNYDERTLRELEDKLFSIAWAMSKRANTDWLDMAIYQSRFSGDHALGNLKKQIFINLNRAIETGRKGAFAVAAAAVPHLLETLSGRYRPRREFKDLRDAIYGFKFFGGRARFRAEAIEAQAKALAVMDPLLGISASDPAPREVARPNMVKTGKANEKKAEEPEVPPDSDRKNHDEQPAPPPSPAHADILVHHFLVATTDAKKTQAAELILRDRQSHREALASPEFLTVADGILRSTTASFPLQLRTSEMILEIAERLRSLRVSHPAEMERLLGTMLLGEFKFRAVDQILDQTVLVFRGHQTQAAAIARVNEILCQLFLEEAGTDE